MSSVAQGTEARIQGRRRPQEGEGGGPEPTGPSADPRLSDRVQLGEASTHPAPRLTHCIGQRVPFKHLPWQSPWPSASVNHGVLNVTPLSLSRSHAPRWADCTWQTLAADSPHNQISLSCLSPPRCQQARARPEHQGVLHTQDWNRVKPLSSR